MKQRGPKHWDSLRRRQSAVLNRPRHRFLGLVHPPQQGLLEGFSSGLIALANHMTMRVPDVQVDLLDLGLASDREVEAQVRAYLARANGDLFVGVTATTASYQAAIRVIRVFKRLRRDCVTILGGSHASAQDEAVLRQHPEVEYVIRGEGEAALAALLSQFPATVGVPNLSFWDGARVRRNLTGPWLLEKELDRIGPSFRGWGLRSAPGKFDHTTYVSARGCPLRCAFCSVSSEAIRAKSIEAVIADLRHLVGEMGFKNIAIEDNFFAQTPERTIALCHAIEGLQREIPFRWDCQTRVESCQRKGVLEAMERAGCEAVYLGVESFDPEQLLDLRKTRAPGRYLEILENVVVPWLLRSRIACYINLQIGLRNEGLAHRERTLLHLRALGLSAEQHSKTITIFPQLHVVYPGTREFRKGLVEGRFGPDGENVFECFTAWEARQQPVLRWLGEHFAHGTGGLPEGILDTDRLRRGEFEVNPNAVLDLVNYLNCIENIPGITVFKYGRYLSGRKLSKKAD